MSYGITPIAVSLAEVRNALGGQPAKPSFWRRLLGSQPNSSEAVLRKIKREFDWRFEQDDFDEEEGEPSLEHALQDLLLGNPASEDFPHKYGYAFELLCHHFGESLNNSEWSSLHFDWLETVDAALTEAGVDAQKLRIGRHITSRGAPISIPRPLDFPDIGYLLSAEIPPALAELGAASFADAEDDVQASIEQVRSWLERCQALQRDLVCFYY